MMRVLEAIVAQRRPGGGTVWVRVALFAVWLPLAAIVAMAGIPDTPVSLPRRLTLNVLAILPEGWGFFTRNPREAVTRVYRKTPFGWQAINERSASLGGQLGLKRTARLRGIELALLLRDVPEKQWVDCDVPMNRVVSDSLPMWTVDNNVAPASLCGDIVVERRERVPWAWARAAHVTMPAKITLLRVTCQ